MKTETILIVIAIYLLFFRRGAVVAPIAAATTNQSGMARTLALNTDEIATMNARIYALEKQLKESDFS